MDYNGAPMVRKLYGYHRKSAELQETGHSDIRQWEAIQRIAEEEKLPIDDTLQVGEVKHCSAFRGRNWTKGNLGRFVTLVRQHVIAKGSVLAIERPSRLSRMPWEDAVEHIKTLLRLGIIIRILEPSMRLTKDNLKDLHVGCPLVIMLMLAHQESLEKSQMVGAAVRHRLNRAREHGECHGLRAPGWLLPIKKPHPLDDRRKVTVGWEPIPERVRIIRRIHELCWEGNGWRKIISILESENIAYWRQGGRWIVTAIQYHLHTRALVGERTGKTRNSYVAPPAGPGWAPYPPILSEEEYQRTQASLRTRPRVSPRKHAKTINLFVGIAKDISGESLRIEHSSNRTGGRWIYLVGEHRRHLVRYDLVYTIVLSMLKKVTVAELENRPYEDASAAEIHRLQAAVESKQLALTALDSQIRELPASSWPSRVVAAISELEAELAKLQEQLRDAKEQGNTSTRAESLTATQSILNYIEGIDDPVERDVTLERLRLRLPTVLEQITVATERGKGQSKWVHIRVAYHGGFVQRLSTKIGNPNPPSKRFCGEW